MAELGRDRGTRGAAGPAHGVLLGLFVTGPCLVKMSVGHFSKDLLIDVRPVYKTFHGHVPVSSTFRSSPKLFMAIWLALWTLSFLLKQWAFRIGSATS